MLSNPTPIQPDGAPRPVGHYSHGLVHNGLLFISGQLPIELGSGRKLTEESAGAQARQALANLDAVLRAANTSRDRVLKTTVFVADIELWGEVNQAYAEFFGDHRPARAIVPTGPLHFGLLVEIEAIASVS